MINKKPKEPLLALMLAFVFPGLGQVYAGRLKRGILFFFIPILCAIPLFLYVINQNTSTSPILLLPAIFFIGFQFFVLVDSYQCAKSYNIVNNLVRKITTGKRVLLFTGIFLFALILGPAEIIAIGLAGYMRNNVVQAFSIPSKTMSPTLMEGDLILVDKAIYKKTELKRGDVIVFIFPQDADKELVKRLVGLPGDSVEIKNNKVYINDKVLEGPAFNRSYYNRGAFGLEGRKITVPKDSYYVLGDNSENSQDSRFFGYVPRKNLIGKAYKIYFPFSRSGPIR